MKLDTTRWAIIGNTGTYTWTAIGGLTTATDIIHSSAGEIVYDGLENPEAENIYQCEDWTLSSGTVHFPQFMLKDENVTTYFTETIIESLFPGHSITILSASSESDSNTDQITVNIDFTGYCTFHNGSRYYPDYEEDAEIEQTICGSYKFVLTKDKD